MVLTIIPRSILGAATLLVLLSACDGGTSSRTDERAAGTSSPAATETVPELPRGFDPLPEEYRARVAQACEEAAILDQEAMATDDINDPRFSEATSKILRALTTPPVPREGRLLLLAFEAQAAQFEKIRTLFGQLDRISARLDQGLPPDKEATLQKQGRELLAESKRAQQLGAASQQRFAAIALRLGLPECAGTILN